MISICKKHFSVFILFSILLSITFVGDVQVEAKTYSTDSSVIVSMGDSYSSGEGIEEFYGQEKLLINKVHDKDWLAHRSKNAWSGQLTLDGVNKTSKAKYDEKNNPNGNWFFVAASGAETKHICDEEQKKPYQKKPCVLSNPFNKPKLPKQIEIFNKLEEKGKKADYVTLTLGGNDADFAGVVATVAHPSYLFPNVIKNKLDDAYYNRKEEIFTKLYKCYENISEKAGKQAYIIVAGYPHLLDKDGKGALVNINEATKINEAVDDFNKNLQRTVEQCSGSMNIRFVSVADKFNNHEAYSDKKQLLPIALIKKKNLHEGEYINRIILGALPQDLNDLSFASSYSMHPNLRGAEAYRECVQEEINKIEKEKAKNKKSHPNNAQNDNVLNKKLNELINKYGKASTEQCQTIYTNSDKYGWTHRKGILSAKLIDLDNNGQNKLVTVRLLEYNKSKNKGELVIETFYADNGVVRSAGSYKLENTNDSENAQINIYTYKIKDKNYLCYERQFYGKWVVDYNRPEYYIFEYKNNNLSKKMRLYNALEGTSGYDYRQSIWTNGKENNIVLQANYSDFKSNGEEYLVHKGKYIKSKYPFNDAMKDFGFTSSSERLLDIDSGYITDFFSYANQTPAKKICTISTREIQSNDIITAQSSAFDYTGLNPSKTEKKTITAEDLFKKPVTEIVKLMENEFTVKKAEIETIYYFYNYNKFPGMDFYFRKDYEDKTSAEKLVKSGSISLEGIEVNGNGIGCYKNDKQVKANYDFKKCSEIYGKIDCLPSNGGMVGGTLEAVEYKENKGNYIIRISFELTSNTRKLVYGSTDYKKIPYKTIIKDNPKVRNIVVQKNYY